MAQGVMEMSRKRKRWRECREGEDEGERKKWEEGDLLINHSGMPADMAATRTPFVGRDEVYLKEVFGMRHCVHTRMYSGACVSLLKQRLALSLLKAQDVLCEVGRSACQQKSGEGRGRW